MVEHIRIISTPPGQTPEWVREQWVGLVLPVDEDAPNEYEGIQFGIRGGRPKNLGGYPVRTVDAFLALEEASAEAAQWWINNLRLELIPRLVFSREVCELLGDDLKTKP